MSFWLRFAVLLLLCRVVFAQASAPDLTLVLEDIRPLDNGRQGHVFVTVEQGGSAPRFRAFADYNEVSANTVRVIAWSADADSVEGELEIEIGPDGARRVRPHFPTPPDRFRVRLRGQLDPVDWAPIRADREAFMPPWRKDTPPVAGRRVTGVYKGVWGSHEVAGTLSGAWRPAPRGGWSAVGPAWVEPRGDQVFLRAFLPETPRVDGIAAWAQLRLDTPLQPRTANIAFRVRLSSPVPRRVFVAIGGEAGWFQHPQALTTGPLPREFLLSVDDFGDRWRPVQGALDALRVGVVDGSGVGAVEVLIHSVGPWTQIAREATATRVNVIVRPEAAFQFNEATEVPPGLFGFHDVNESRPRPAREGEADAVEMLRRLRPGFLRPLTHTDFSVEEMPDGDLIAWRAKEERPWLEEEGVFERRVDAAEARGRVVWTHSSDLWARPVWMDGGLEAFLPRVEAYYARLGAEAWSPEHPRRLLRDLEVWNEPFMWGRHINMGFRLPAGARDLTDETQFGYIPGRLGSEAWVAIFRAAARGARGTNPHVRLGGPSAPDFAQNDYRDFRNYTLRILEAAGGELDFLTEHHYGGNPLLTAAGYEVARAALWTLHQRRIPILNTEANDLGASDAGRALWNLVDILHLIRTQPDIAHGRALHACWDGYLRSPGEEQAWLLLAPLRGRLIDMDVDSPRLTAVASHPEKGRLVVVGADHGVGEVDLRLPMPVGFRVEELTLLLTDAPVTENELRDVDGAELPPIPQGKTRLVTVPPRVSEGFLRFPLPARSAFRVILQRPGYEPSRVRSHSFTPLPILFKSLDPGEELSLAVDRRFEPDRAFLRIVHTGSLTLRAGDATHPLPRGPAREGAAELQMIEIPAEQILLKPRLVAGEGGACVLSAGWVMEE